jgi:tetratricopeptide (TPR) repeat protein
VIKSGTNHAYNELLNEAHSCIDNTDFNGAKSLLKKALKLAPHKSEPYHMQSLIAYSEGRLDDAGEMILEAITRNETDPTLHANCGAIMNLLGRPQEAEAACRHAIDLDPSNSEPHNNLAVSLEVQGRLTEAQDSAIRAIEINPQYLEACINLGNILLRIGEPLTAIDAYRAAIKLDNSAILARTNLSIALRQTGQIILAEKECRKAIEINPKLAEGYNSLGNILKDKEVWKGSILAFEKAITLRSGYTDAMLNLAGVLFKSGDIEGAQAKYEEIINIFKNLPEAHAGLGVVLLGVGNIEKAIESFEKAVAIKPTLGMAQYNLASGIGDSYDATRIASIRELLENITLSETDRTLIYFSLGEINDKQGNYKSAFSDFNEGNQLLKKRFKKEQKNFVANEFDLKINNLITTFNKDFFEQNKIRGNTSEQPVFIVGMPRSGTTLVEQIIASHSQVVGKGELDLISTICREEDLTNASIKTITKKANFYLSEVKKNSEGALRIVDKMPFNWLHMGQIQIMFPEARIIYTHRNPLDTGFSCFSQYFTAPHSWACDLVDISRFQKAMIRFMNHIKIVTDLRILDISYEDLVLGQEEVSREIIHFLGLDWEKNCLKFHKITRTVETASSWQVRKPIYKNAIGRANKYGTLLEPLKQNL